MGHLHLRIHFPAASRVAGCILFCLCTGLALASSNTTTFEYDNLGRLKQVDRPNGARTTYYYDTEGNRTRLVNVGKPVIQITIDPPVFYVGYGVRVNWATIGATALSVTCTAQGTGFQITNLPAAPANQGQFSFLASEAWVGFPSTCTWTASGPAGVSTYTHLLETLVQKRLKPGP
jgi:YD repeat-containing protein